MKVTAKTKICMVIGDPIEHSLSPQIHNAGYQALGIADQFVYIASKIKNENLSDFIRGVRTMQINGASITVPHKISVMQFLDEIDATAQKIGAVNTIVNENGKLKGYNTDWLGVINPLEEIISLKNKKAAVLGAGGAARAAIFGLLKKGCIVTIFNRTLTNAKKLGQEFNCGFYSLNDTEKIKEVDIIFNTIPTNLNNEFITGNQIIFDAIYSPLETKLLKEAKGKGARIIHGTEMLLHQGAAQFELFTDHKAPIEEMRKTLLINI